MRVSLFPIYVSVDVGLSVCMYEMDRETWGERQCEIQSMGLLHLCIKHLYAYSRPV
jgi:hypothetical protein